MVRKKMENLEIRLREFEKVKWQNEARQSEVDNR